MSFSSMSVSIEAKKFSGTSWADTSDHTKTVGLQAMGFYQWNVNLFYVFPDLMLNYADEVNFEKPYDITDTGTMTLQVIDGGGLVYTTAKVTFEYREKKYGKVKKDKDGNKTYEWNYLYNTQFTGLEFGAEKFATFNGLRLIIDCKTKNKKKKETRLSSLRGASVMWFRAVPSKNMANVSYSTDFTTREVFHFGQFKDKSSDDQKGGEEPAPEEPPSNEPTPPPEAPPSDEPTPPPEDNPGDW